MPADAVAGVKDNAASGYQVTAYVVKGNLLLSTNVLNPVLARHTGANVSLEELVRAAADLQAEYRDRGYPMMSVAFAREQITNGVATLNVFQAAVPQIVVSGKCYLRATNAPAVASNPAPAAPILAQMPPSATAVAKTVPPVVRPPPVPASPAQIADARTALFQKMGEDEAREKDTRIHVVSTNAGPRFAVEKYLVQGNSVLPPESVAGVLTNIDGAYGTNVSYDGVRTAVEQLQGAYRERGYVTVAVGLPQQKLTNETVKLQVTEGWLAAINVTGNRYFSSNNVMRALPSLHTGTLLNGPIFQAELNRANASQDRQIYPVIGPGTGPGTSELTLRVKDQLPLHGKLEFNNESTPGTPDMRVNASAIADNLWQQEHSFGIQYGFSPEAYKAGTQWDFYDQPLVADYSAFYRLPVGNPEPIEEMVANNPGNFGYNEATRQFRLPPPSGATELNLYASRATIDTGLETLKDDTLFNVPLVRVVTQQEFQQGITINEDVGFQLTRPLPQAGSLHSTLSGGLDYKVYSQVNYQTNIFNFAEWTKNGSGALIERISHVDSQTPTTDQELDYLPLGLNYSAGLNNFLGTATLGLGLSVNLWYSSSTLYSLAGTNPPPPNLYGRQSLQNITGSAKSTGHWVVLRPSYSQDIVLYTNWVATIRADGQWASEPLISSEQFGIGGVNSVRGYHEGEVFGDTGWHVSLEQQTPPHIVGLLRDNTPLTIRGSVYMDYARIFLLDPQGRPDSVPLWSTGLGIAASAGPHWQTQFLFSWPLLSTGITEAYQPFFNFVLTAQF